MAALYNLKAMDKPNLNTSAERTDIEYIIDRVERLLLRHVELQHTNLLLNQQISALSNERDSLKSRLSAARSRVDALLERLPENAGMTPPSHTESER